MLDPDIFSNSTKFIDIRKNNHVKNYELNFYGLERSLPICKSGEINIVGNTKLSFGSDVEFTKLAARKMVTLLKIDCILTAESRPIPIAYELSKQLNLKNMAVARKNIKNDSKVYLAEELKSTATSSYKQKLYLDKFNASLIKNKKILIFDDVISTGNTIEVLLNLAKKAGAKVIAISAIWIEGPWAYHKLTQTKRKYNFYYLDVFPIYASGKKFSELVKQTNKIKDQYYQTINKKTIINNFSRYWRIKSKDKILILSDIKSSELFIDSLSRLLKESGALVDIDKNLPLDFKNDFPTTIKNKIKNYSVIILAASQSWYHAPTRRRAKYEYKNKVLECYGMCPEILKNGGFFTDFKKMAALGDDVLNKIKNNGIIEISNKKGLNLKLKYSSAFVESGLYQNPGSGGNFPSGEISFGITSNDANGTLIFNISFDELGDVSQFPLTFHIQNGKIIKIEGEDKGIIKRYFKKYPTLSYIAEIGIGINPNCILNRTILEDEKKAGTIHVGFGNNSYFGGENNGPHYDGTIADATIKINGKTILSNGKFNKNILNKESKKFLKNSNLLNN
ncbi:MAG: phosphoribosyltransferase family protein [Patescibacteria group bacterium]|nr:phosphoribosyltransferase family protein [Patescibacteria group bacterium]